MRSNDNVANNNIRTGNQKHSCDCGCEGENDTDLSLDSEDTIAMALKLILDKIDTIEKGQEYLIKKSIR